MGDPRALIDRLTAAQNAHDLEAMLDWTGTKADGTPLEECGVIVMGIRDDRIAWGRLYVGEVERESADIDTVVRHMAGTEDR